jgi:hypothetical protein
MDARVKPGHDECFCVAWFKAQFRDLAARFRARFAKNVPPSEIQRAQGMPGAQ